MGAGEPSQRPAARPVDRAVLFPCCTRPLDASHRRRDTVIVEIECLPMPPGTAESPYVNVEAAIAVIQASGLKYEVSALGSTFEGEPDAVWPLIRRVHEATLSAGAKSVVSIVKLFEAAAEEPPTMSSLTSKFRDEP